MNAFVRCLVASCFTAALAAVPASAGALLVQPAIVNGASLTSGPFNGGYVRGFDDFKLNANDTITSVSWVGWTEPAGTTFQVGFTTDASMFYPNTSLFINETVTPTVTYFAANQDTFTVTLPTQVNLAANTDYWISIYAPDATLWSWSSASAAPSPGALPQGISAGYVSAFGATNLDGIDLAFTLNGVPTNSVPEPATLAIFGAGLMGVAGLKRRKKRG